MKIPKDNLHRHLHKLSAEIGERPQGSPACHAAAAYIQGIFEQAGLVVEYQRYDCPAWTVEETTLEANGHRLDAAANAFSPSCDVQAPLVPLCSIAELENADLRGRIALLYGDLTRAPLCAKSWFLLDERDAHYIQLLEEKQPAALITIQMKGELNRLTEDWELEFPSACVPAHTGRALLQTLPTVHLRIRSQRTPGHAGNIVARLPGRGPTRIAIMAHYDTKIDTPGACDNATGVAVLLELAQTLSTSTPAHTLEFIAFCGEEYLPIGDDEYLRRISDERGPEASLGQVVAAINFDGAGYILGSTSIMITQASAEFQALAEEVKRAYPGVVWVDPWPESNHSTFAFRGVPSLAFSSAGLAALAHLRSDQADWVNPAKMAETTSLARDLVSALQGQSPAWTRPTE